MATEEQIPKMAGVLVEHQKFFGALSTEDAQWVIQHPREAIALSVTAIKNRQKETPSEPEPILKLISAGRNLVLGACDGTKVIAKAKKTFRSGIDSDFEKWRADEPGQPTPGTVPDVYEMVRDATFSQMFGFLNADAGKLCLTQHQIIDFVEKYPGWLRADGYANFFLFKSYGHFFVARVDVRSGGLYVNARRFERSVVWRAGYRHRVVVPQLALAT